MLNSPIKLYSTNASLDDEAMMKLSQVINNQEKTIKVTASYDEAKRIAKRSMLEGYQTSIVDYGNSYHVNVKPRVEIDLQEAEQSGQFKKLAFGRYAFTKEANNPLGIQHYNFDDGTIWKVSVGKDGKEYLVKEVDDKNEDKVIRSVEKNMTKATVLASATSKIDTKQLARLAKILYDNPADEFINDLMQASVNVLSKVVTAKLNKVVNSELEALNITSPLYREKAKEKVAHAISSNIIFNKQQIAKIITDFNKINLDALKDMK